MTIGGTILLMDINGYYISGYWWLFFIILNYIMTISGYFIINYCWIFQAMLS